MARHAGTGRAALRCALSEGSVVVEVTDEWAGFDVEADQAAYASGLIGIKERAVDRRQASGRVSAGRGHQHRRRAALAETPGPER